MSAILRAGFPTFLCIGLMSGCSIGPTVIRNNMVRYNESVVDVENEQFLLNLVRIRYCEIPKTLGVTNVTSQFTLTGQSPLSGTLTHFSKPPGGTTPMALAAFTGAFQTNFSDVPTVSFIPQSGADFNRGLVVPLGLDRIVLLCGTGWDLETVFRLTVQNLNRVENTPHVIAQHRPVHYSPEFDEVVAALGRLHHQSKLYLAPDPQPVLAKGVISDPNMSIQKQKNGDEKAIDIKGADLISAAEKHLKFVRGPEGKVVLRSTFDAYKMNVDDDAFGDADLVCALNRLKVGPGKQVPFQGRNYRLLPVDKTPNDPDENDIYVGTRNVIGCSVFASKGIEIPEAHYRDGLVEPAVDDMGQPFDWTMVTKGLFHVYVEKHRPKHAFVSVNHRGYWFYIADDDKVTKSSFALLKEMFDVQIAPGLSTAPILTISTSGTTP